MVKELLEAELGMVRLESAESLHLLLNWALY